MRSLRHHRDALHRGRNHAQVANGDGKSYPVTLTAVRSFCGCNDALFRGKTCKHAVALASVCHSHARNEVGNGDARTRLEPQEGAHSRGFGTVLMRRACQTGIRQAPN